MRNEDPKLAKIVDHKRLSAVSYQLSVGNCRCWCPHQQPLIYPVAYPAEWHSAVPKLVVRTPSQRQSHFRPLPSHREAKSCLPGVCMRKVECSATQGAGANFALYHHIGKRNHAPPGFASERLSAAQHRSSAAKIPPLESSGRAGATR